MTEQFTSGMDFETSRSNPMAAAAVERKLQIIGEAAIRLEDEAGRRCRGAKAAAGIALQSHC